jgi:spermidine/putrescine transport system ATP-binding protein
LIGPSGCGKSTLLRTLNRMYALYPGQRAEGEILLDGENMAYTPPHRRNVNTVFQSYALFPHMSVWDNVAFGLRRQKTPKHDVKTRVDEALGMVQMDRFAKRKPAQLSGGQQQRVALARALVLKPAVLLLDEPLGALDLKLRERMKIELKQLQADFGTTFVYITHDQSEALVLSDHVAVMNAGRFEQVGTPQELYYRPATPFVAGFVGANNRVAGKANEIDAGIVLMTTSQGLSVRARASGTLAAGDAVEAFVRPEVVDIARDANELPRGGQRFAGRVASLLFDGANSAVLVTEETTRAEIRIALPQTGRFADLSVDEKIAFGFDAERAVCFRV